MKALSLGAVALLFQSACALAGPRAAPRPREISVVPAVSAPRVSVARDSAEDVVTYVVGAFVYPPFAVDAVRGMVQLAGDVRRAEALRAHTGPELHAELADAVLSATAGGARLVRAEPAEDQGCGAMPGPAFAGETFQVAVTSVAWVPAPGPDAPLGLSVAVRGVLRGPDGSCAERTLLVASSEERFLDAWRAGDARALRAELSARLGEAGSRLVAQMIER